MKPFFYDLPESRIAQRPVHPPEAARLLVNERESGWLTDSTFSDIGSFLRAGDALVFNNSKVLPARLFGSFAGGGEAELLLLKRIVDGLWECMGRPLKKFKSGTVLSISAGLKAVVQERIGEKTVLIRFEAKGFEQVDEAIFEHGCMPIPPYIRQGHGDADDVIDYQSIFAKIEGSIAAPTASLHFSPSLIDSLREKGVQIFEVTLHVGSASFLAVWDPERGDEVQPPGVEFYAVDRNLLESLSKLKKSGGRVIAVGTTVTRALESMHRSQASDGALCQTDLFITPGFEFKTLDGMVTNFHQPGTTHLLLVEAFLGRGGVAQLYDHALSQPYRFLSYGDGCLLL